MKRILLFIGTAIFMFSAKAQTSSYSIPDGNYLTIGNYSSSNDSKGILFTGFRDVVSNYFGASIDAVNSWVCCNGYPGAGYAGVKHIGLNFNIHTPGDWSADAKTTVMSIATSGNVGIGTTDPQYKLHVNGNIYTNSTLFVGNNLQVNDEGGHVYLSCRGSDNRFVFYGNNQWQKVTCGDFQSVGNIQVDGKLKVSTYAHFAGSTAPTISDQGAYINWNALTGGTGETDFINNPGTGSGGFAFMLGNSAGTSKTTAVFINGSGNVGIGTTSPDQKLTVNGKIHAQEVIIDLNVPVADYVFSKDYELMPLPEVEKYVQENRHLPEIPSATEVKEKGMSMGEMQNQLLKKVEELTLYVIQQDKRIQALEEENKRLKK